MKPFHFKQFRIEQDLCAMKIGTDGVLLGAWTSLENSPKSILDIGSGTGIIGLQLAQRSKATRIDAVEIDKNAFEQCTKNFKNSPWSDRLTCFHASFENFLAHTKRDYDLIVSNPPFFDENFKTGNAIRDLARFSSSLSFETLIKGAAKLLTNPGVLCVIVPKSRETDFIELALAEKLHLQKRTDVRGNKNSVVKRSLLEFGFEQVPVQVDELNIEYSRHQYTEAYVALTKDFYLNM